MNESFNFADRKWENIHNARWNWGSRCEA